MTYSLSFRQKAFAIKEKEGLTMSELSKRLHVGTATLFRWKKKIEPCMTRNKPATKIDMKTLEQDVLERPDDYQWERAQRFSVSPNTILYALRRIKKTYKKNPESPQGR